LNQKFLLSITLAGILLVSSISLGAFAQEKGPRDLPEVSQVPFKVKVIRGGGLTAFVLPLYTTFDAPFLHITSAGGTLDGVGELILTRSDFTVRCSGALLPTGKHVLTAAHCITDDRGRLNLLSGYVTFEGDLGDEKIDVISAIKHPKFKGDVLRGNDIAVLELATAASLDITRYDIDRNPADDVGSVGIKAGYGKTGQGDEGAVDPSGTKHDGKNKYDATAREMYQALRLNQKQYFADGILQFDFDNLKSANDAFGFFFDIHDTGLGTPEVNSAPGDSGGPTQTNGVITGVTSYGLTLTYNTGKTSDVTPRVVDSSFGEFSGDTRVSQFTSFIDDAMNGGTDDDSGGPNCPPKKQEKGKC